MWHRGGGRVGVGSRHGENHRMNLQLPNGNGGARGDLGRSALGFDDARRDASNISLRPECLGAGIFAYYTPPGSSRISAPLALRATPTARRYGRAHRRRGRPPAARHTPPPPSTQSQAHMPHAPGAPHPHQITTSTLHPPPLPVPTPPGAQAKPLSALTQASSPGTRCTVYGARPG